MEKCFLALYWGNIISDVASAQWTWNAGAKNCVDIFMLNGGKCITSGSRSHLLGGFTFILYIVCYNIFE
jgi:hypothetical protein